MSVDEQAEDQRTLVGYGPAARHVGLRMGTFRTYVLRDRGPAIARRERDGQYVRPVFLVSELDRWLKNRPGQGKGGGRPAREQHDESGS